MSEKTIAGKPCKTCSNQIRYKIGGACVYCAKQRSTERAKRNVKGVWKHRLSNIDVVNKTAICAACGQISIKKKRSGWRCKVGSMWRPSADYIKAYYERTRGERKFGSCGICKKEKPLCWDHDHKSGQHRGWLCHHCNVGIGFLLDDINILKAAIEYLS